MLSYETVVAMCNPGQPTAWVTSYPLYVTIVKRGMQSIPYLGYLPSPVLKTDATTRRVGRKLLTLLYALLCYVLVEFFGTGEVEVVAVVTAVEVTVVLFVAAADSGAVFVYLAAIVFVEVIAAVGDIDVPLIIFNKNADSFVCKVPTYVFVIGLGCRVLDWQCNVAAAEACAFFTQWFGRQT